MEQKLETFLTLCHTMHYGRAAELLSLSQPAVSKHIQALESQYGVSLFTYCGRRLQKTKQGEILEQYAQSLRYNEDCLLEQLHKEQKKNLRVGATKSIGRYLLLPYIRKFLEKAENRLDFLVDNTNHLLQLIREGKMDFAVIEGIFDKSKFDYIPFRTEPYIGICPKKHPFAEKEVSVEEILKERIILREKGSGTRRILERELSNKGYDLNVFENQICISSFDIIKTLVEEGYGISFLYEAVVKNEAENIGHFTCPPLTGMHEFNVVFLKGTDARQKVADFIAASS